MKIKTAKEKSIETIQGLISGRIKATDLPPRMILRQDLEGNRTYSINGVSVSKAAFDEECGKWPWDAPGFKSFGRPNDDEEYYYGEVPFTIYTDGTPI